jgi:hypothetical protein
MERSEIRDSADEARDPGLRFAASRLRASGATMGSWDDAIMHLYCPTGQAKFGITEY